MFLLYLVDEIGRPVYLLLFSVLGPLNPELAFVCSEKLLRTVSECVKKVLRSIQHDILLITDDAPYFRMCDDSGQPVRGVPAETLEQ